MTARSFALRALLSIGIMGAQVAGTHAEEQQGSPQATRKVCPTPKQQQQQAGKTNGAGSELPAAQPMEKSGILPAVGEDKTSAAPTVQQRVTTPTVGPDCELSPVHPNALNQPAHEKVLPPPSK